MQIDDGLARELAEKWMPGYPHLARHEWREHGTCTGLDQRGYFTALTAPRPFSSVFLFQQAMALDAAGRYTPFADAHRVRQWLEPGYAPPANAVRRKKG